MHSCKCLQGFLWMHLERNRISCQGPKLRENAVSIWAYKPILFCCFCSGFCQPVVIGSWFEKHTKNFSATSICSTLSSTKDAIQDLLYNRGRVQELQAFVSTVHQALVAVCQLGTNQGLLFVRNAFIFQHCLLYLQQDMLSLLAVKYIVTVYFSSLFKWINFKCEVHGRHSTDLACFPLTHRGKALVPKTKFGFKIVVEITALTCPKLKGWF